jgi:NarL family two-component system response regulator LiaR
MPKVNLIRSKTNPLDQISPRIRVLIVDDRVVMRTGLKFFLLAFDDFELVGEAVNGEHALFLCGQTKPDVVLMDLDRPSLDGVSTARAIRWYCPQIKIIALTGFRQEKPVQRVLRVGAINYLCRNISADRLAEAIRTVHAAP